MRSVLLGARSRLLFWRLIPGRRAVSAYENCRFTQHKEFFAGSVSHYLDSGSFSFIYLSGSRFVTIQACLVGFLVGWAPDREGNCIARQGQEFLILYYMVEAGRNICREGSESCAINSAFFARSRVWFKCVIVYVL